MNLLKQRRNGSESLPKYTGPFILKHYIYLVAQRSYILKTAVRPIAHNE